MGVGKLIILRPHQASFIFKQYENEVLVDLCCYFLRGSLQLLSSEEEKTNHGCN